jgi:hypothetical protein
MNFALAFKGIQFETIDEVAAETLAKGCAYLVPSAPIDEKIGFFGILNSASSFLEEGVGHFNPQYKQDKDNGNSVWIIHF